MADYAHKTEFPGFFSRFKVGDKVKFRDPEFEDDKVHTVKKVDVETLNGHPWKIRIELENGVRRYDDHFILANAARSRNAVVQKALNAVARNGRAIPVDSKGKGIIERCKIRTADGEVAEVAHIDEDGFVYFKSKDGRVRGVSADTVTRLNADTSVLRETAVNAKFKVGDRVIGELRTPSSVGTVVKVEKFRLMKVKFDEDGTIFTVDQNKFMPYTNSTRTTNAVIAKAMNAQAVCNASYSAALKTILDAVKPYMDRRIKDDTSWRYPALVISKLRDVCERAVMSAGRYDGKRPPHRVYDIECVKDGFKFSGNLIVSGLLHRDDPDDVSAFDEYDMILSLGYTGRA